MAAWRAIFLVAVCTLFISLSGTHFVSASQPVHRLERSDTAPQDYHGPLLSKLTAAEPLSELGPRAARSPGPQFGGGPGRGFGGGGFQPGFQRGFGGGGFQPGYQPGFQGGGQPGGSGSFSKSSSSSSSGSIDFGRRK